MFVALTLLRGRHSDTPYGSGNTFMDWQEVEWPDPTRPMGVQCNVCIDEYTEENGATYAQQTHPDRDHVACDGICG